jgi:hypothetical protein
MALPFRPNCQPTSLGPLPHTDASSAWDVVLRHTPGLPALPLVVNRGADLARWSIEGFGGVSKDGDQLTIDRTVALRCLDSVYADYLRGTTVASAGDLVALPRHNSPEQTPFRRTQTVLGLVLGPVSLAMMLIDDRGEPVVGHTELLDGLAKHVYLRRQVLHKTLERSGKPVLVWVYEPYLTIARSPFASLSAEELHAAADQTLGNGVPRALWVSDLPTALHLPETLYVDLVAMPLPVTELASIAAPWLKLLLERKAAVGWGVVPVTAEGLRSATVGRLAARFSTWLQALEAEGVPTDQLLASSLVMPEDTLMYLEPAEAERALALTAELSSLIQQSYGVD